MSPATQDSNELEIELDQGISASEEIRLTFSSMAAGVWFGLDYSREVSFVCFCVM